MTPCPKCGGKQVNICPTCGSDCGDLVKHLTGSTDYYFQHECRSCPWTGWAHVGCSACFQQGVAS